VATPTRDDSLVTTLPPISSHERHWNAEIARRRPDLVAEEAGSLHRMIERYLELGGSEYGTVAHVLTDRTRVLRHLIDARADETAGAADPASLAGRHLAEQVGSDGAWTDSQADGTIVVSFGPRRGNGAYVLDPAGQSRWVTPARYAA